MAAGRRWTRDELLVALNLYHKLNFGQLDQRNPVIIAFAERLGRTPSSAAMKLCNLASLDSALKLRGIQGLPGASNLDRAIWEEFHAKPVELVPESEAALETLFQAGQSSGIEVIPRKGIKISKRLPEGPTDIMANVKVRRGQQYFRDAVINNFGGQCGVTGLPIRELLVASHILPWSHSENERLNVRNGICLNRLHDAAFDRGFIGFNESFGLIISQRLRRHLPHDAIKNDFERYEGVVLTIPHDALVPDEKFLSMHRSRWAL